MQTNPIAIGCLFCGNPVQLIYVHGHYQCAVCKTNALPCCYGDNCNNFFIPEKENKAGQYYSLSNTNDQLHINMIFTFAAGSGNSVESIYRLLFYVKIMRGFTIVFAKNRN